MPEDFAKNRLTTVIDRCKVRHAFEKACGFRIGRRSFQSGDRNCKSPPRKPTSPLAPQGQGAFLLPVSPARIPVPADNASAPSSRINRQPDGKTRAAELNPDRLKDASMALLASLLADLRVSERHLCGFRWERCAKDSLKLYPGSIREALVLSSPSSRGLLPPHHRNALSFQNRNLKEMGAQVSL